MPLLKSTSGQIFCGPKPPLEPPSRGWQALSICSGWRLSRARARARNTTPNSLLVRRGAPGTLFTTRTALLVIIPTRLCRRRGGSRFRVIIVLFPGPNNPSNDCGDDDGDEDGADEDKSLSCLVERS
jgi:hypothetical protein